MDKFELKMIEITENMELLIQQSKELLSLSRTTQEELIHVKNTAESARKVARITTADSIEQSELLGLRSRQNRTP